MIYRSRRRLRIRAPGLYAAQKLGLMSGLQLVLDAGDKDSYSSGQSFIDRLNGHNFHVGATSGSEASDPTFTGTAGSLTSSTYFELDGGDYFALNVANAAANPAWVKTYHRKTTALSIAMWLTPGSTASQRFCGTTQTSATGGSGFRWGITNSTTMAFVVHDGANGTSFNPTITLSTIAEDAWGFFCISLNESVGASGGFGGYNGGYSTAFTSTYSADGITDSVAVLQIGASAAAAIMPATSRFGQAWFWNAAKTQADFTLLYQATRPRYATT